MKFNLLNKEIEISEGKKNYMQVLKHFTTMSDIAKNKFRSDYNNTLGTIIFNANYGEKFKQTYGSSHYMDKIVIEYVAQTRKFLTSHGIYDVSDSTIWDNAVISEDRDMSILQYEFDLYILNCIEKEVDDDTFISWIKSKLEGNYFLDCLHNDIMRLCDWTMDYLNDNTDLEIEFVYQKDAEKAEAIYQNLNDDILTDEKAVEILLSIPEDLSGEEFDTEYKKRSSNITASDKNKLAVEMIELDPRKRQYYEYIFKQIPQAKYDIVAIANYLNIDLSNCIEADLKKSFNLKNIPNEEKALAMMNDLKVSMNKYGITKSEVKTELEKILNAFDVEARTYGGFLYETRALCEQAKKDDITLKNIYGDVSALEKSDCKRIIAEITNASYTENIKEKHIQILQNRIFAFDKEYFQQLICGVENFDEAKCTGIKDIITSYDTTEDIKSTFLSQVDKRLYQIWDKEDFERFSELFKQTQPDDYNKILENTKIIKTEGRTKVKDLFVDAINSLIAPYIESAAKYAVAKEGGTFSSLLNIGKKGIYETLTLNGRVMHPAMEVAMEKVRAEKSNGFLSKLGFKKN